MIAKICAQTLDGNIELTIWRLNWIPIKGNGIQRDLLNLIYNIDMVFVVRIENSLFGTVLATVPELPRFQILLNWFIFAKHQHHNRLDYGRSKWSLWISNIIQRETIEFALIYVGYPVLLLSSARRNGRLQVALETVGRVNLGNFALVQIPVHLIPGSPLAAAASTCATGAASTPSSWAAASCCGAAGIAAGSAELAAGAA